MAGRRWDEALLAPCGTPAAARRHRRRKEPLDEACRLAARADAAERKGVTRLLGEDHREIRNGIPWRPYRYRGSGADAYTGEVVEL